MEDKSKFLKLVDQKEIPQITTQQRIDSLESEKLSLGGGSNSPSSKLNASFNRQKSQKKIQLQKSYKQLDQKIQKASFQSQASLTLIPHHLVKSFDTTRLVARVNSDKDKLENYLENLQEHIDCSVSRTNTLVDCRIASLFNKLQKCRQQYVDYLERLQQLENQLIQKHNIKDLMADLEDFQSFSNVLKMDIEGMSEQIKNNLKMIAARNQIKQRLQQQLKNQNLVNLDLCGKIATLQNKYRQFAMLQESQQLSQEGGGIDKQQSPEGKSTSTSVMILNNINKQNAKSSYNLMIQDPIKKIELYCGATVARRPLIKQRNMQKRSASQVKINKVNMHTDQEKEEKNQNDNLPKQYFSDQKDASKIFAQPHYISDDFIAAGAGNIQNANASLDGILQPSFNGEKQASDFSFQLQQQQNGQQQQHSTNNSHILKGTYEISALQHPQLQQRPQPQSIQYSFNSSNNNQLQNNGNDEPSMVQSEGWQQGINSSKCINNSNNNNSSLHSMLILQNLNDSSNFGVAIGGVCVDGMNNLSLNNNCSSQASNNNLKQLYQYYNDASFHSMGSKLANNESVEYYYNRNSALRSRIIADCNRYFDLFNLFCASLNSERKHLEQLQKIVMKQEGMNGSLLFEMKRQEFFLTETEIAKSMNQKKTQLADREMRNLVHDTLKDMLEQKREKQQREKDDEDLYVEWDTFKKFSPIQIIGLMALKPQVFDDVKKILEVKARRIRQQVYKNRVLSAQNYIRPTHNPRLFDSSSIHQTIDKQTLIGNHGLQAPIKQQQTVAQKQRYQSAQVKSLNQ